MTYNIIFSLIGLLGTGFGYFMWQQKRKEVQLLLGQVQLLQRSNDVKDKQLQTMSNRLNVDVGKLLEDGTF